MDLRALVGYLGLVAIAGGIVLVAHYAEAWGGLVVAGGVGGWVALLGSRYPHWELHDGVHESPPTELVTFMSSGVGSVLHVVDYEN